MSHMPVPKEAEPPFTELMRDFAIKKKAMSKMKAISATAAAPPEKQVLQHVIENSRTCARRPKMAEIQARTRATMCRTKA